MASTASSLSIRPQPPLVCHIPFSTLHISSESLLLLTVTRRFSFVAVLTSTHRMEFAPLPRRRESLVAEFKRVAVENRRWWWWLNIAVISCGLSLTQKTQKRITRSRLNYSEWMVSFLHPFFKWAQIRKPIRILRRALFLQNLCHKISIIFQLYIN